MHVAHVSPKRRRTTVRSPTLVLDVKCKPGHPNKAYMSEITRRCACTKWCILSAYHHPHDTCKHLETTTRYKRCSQRAHTLMGIKLTRRNKALPTQNTFYEDSETSLANQRNETRKRETERVKGPPNARTGSKTLHNCLKLRRASHQVFHRRGACNIKIATRSTKPSRFGEHP